MKKQFHTSEGVIERELTEEEIQKFADSGDDECLKYLEKKEYVEATNLEEKIGVIARCLGLE